MANFPLDYYGTSNGCQEICDATIKPLEKWSISLPVVLSGLSEDICCICLYQSVDLNIIWSVFLFPSLSSGPLASVSYVSCCHDNSTAGIRDYLVLQAHTAGGSEVSMGTVFQVHPSSYQDTELSVQMFREHDNCEPLMSMGVRMNMIALVQNWVRTPYTSTYISLLTSIHKWH